MGEGTGYPLAIVATERVNRSLNGAHMDIPIGWHSTGRMTFAPEKAGEARGRASNLDPRRTRFDSAG